METSILKGTPVTYQNSVRTEAFTAADLRKAIDRVKAMKQPETAQLALPERLRTEYHENQAELLRIAKSYGFKKINVSFF